ncbi:MAG: hemerythrin domain-containing protein [Candidatus Latescibacteria bacterium]|jgi:hypothetical protein|nr:hemerythrin domain-containing protein [Candidatus Latescibacterota bacterium]
MKRIPELRDLFEDHHHGLVLARHARRASENNELVEDVWAEVIQKFETELDIHFKIEEDCLSGPMKAAGEGGMVDRLHDEHRRLRALVALPQTVESLAAFGALLEKHIRFEEREFFERAQELLDHDVLNGVAKACRLRAV